MTAIAGIWKKHHFVILLASVVAFAWIFPVGGRSGGYFQSQITTKIGVFIIFLLQGLTIPTEQLKAGASNMRLHGFVLGTNFVFIPILGYLFILLLGLLGDELAAPNLRLGILYLAILPTTVSSAVAFVSVSRGNVAGAIFATATSNILGVFIVPVLAAWMLAAQGGVEVDVLPLLWKLFVLVVLPMIIGQIIRPFAASLVKRIKPYVKTTNNGIIFFIVYCAFCNTVSKDVWASLGAVTIVAAVLSSVILLLTVSWLVWQGSRFAGLDPASRVTAFYCASQKTLAAGVPMASSIFAGLEDTLNIGLILTPLLVYHPAQLFLASFVKDKLATSVPEVSENDEG